MKSHIGTRIDRKDNKRTLTVYMVVVIDQKVFEFCVGGKLNNRDRVVDTNRNRI